MLVLSRKIGESILVGDNITIEITAVEGDRVYVGISARRDVRIYRKELLEQTISTNKMAVDLPSNLSFEHLKRDV